MSYYDLEELKQQMRIAIQAASIARQYHDMMASGISEPSQFEMKCFIEKAIEIANLFEFVADSETEEPPAKVQQ